METLEKLVEMRKREILEKLWFCIKQEMFDGVDKLTLAYSRLCSAEAVAHGIRDE